MPEVHYKERIMNSPTLTVRGLGVVTMGSSRQQRRYVVVALRQKPFTTSEGTYVAFARAERSSDSLQAARQAANKYTRQNAAAPGGLLAVVVDTATGLEVAS